MKATDYDKSSKELVEAYIEFRKLTPYLKHSARSFAAGWNAAQKRLTKPNVLIQ